MMTPTWRNWIQQFSRTFLGGRRPEPAACPQRCRRLLVERLEDRIHPSVTIAPTNNGGNGYTGLDFNQSGGYAPPDTSGAAGPTNFVEAVNQTVAIYSPKGNGTTEISDSFGHFMNTVGGLPPNSFLGDNMVVYDDQIGKFIVGDEDVNFGNNVCKFDIAVSKTSSPATLTKADWNFYQIDTTEGGGAYFADYPGNFGYNHDAFVFTLNMFGATNHVMVTSVNQSDLANGVSQAQLRFYQNDLAGFSARPTTMHDSIAGDPMWLIMEHGDYQSIDVIKMDKVLSSSAKFSTTNLAVTPYSPVATPLNPDGSPIVFNIDTRIMKAAEAGNMIVATHHVGVSGSQDDAQWYEIDVSSGTPVMAQQGRVSAGNNTYLFYPGIDINAGGQIGMSYMQSGTDSPTDYMSMWITGRNTSDPSGTMESSVLVPAGTGQANYVDFGAFRAGDMSAINIDPVNGSFWAANEFANTEAVANWGTAIVNFTLAPAKPTFADLGVTGKGPATGVEGNNATFTLTVTNLGPDPAVNAILTDTLGANLNVLSWTTSLGTVTRVGNVLTFSFGNLGLGQTATCTVTGQFTEDGTISNTAVVSSATTDPNPNNNTAITPVKVSEPKILVSGPLPVTHQQINNITAATFIHANGVEPNSAFTAIIHWGDGTSSVGIVTHILGTYSVKGSHTYAQPGTHIITATVTEAESAASAPFSASASDFLNTVALPLSNAPALPPRNETTAAMFPAPSLAPEKQAAPFKGAVLDLVAAARSDLFVQRAANQPVAGETVVAVPPAPRVAFALMPETVKPNPGQTIIASSGADTGSADDVPAANWWNLH